MNKVLTLGDVASIVDCEHKTAPISENGSYFAVGTPAMKGNLISFAEARRIDEGTFLEWTTRLRPVHGDLLLAREAPVGPVVRIPPAENVAPGQRTVLIRPDDNHVDGLFLFYLLISPMMQRRMGTLAAGSTVAHLNVADVRNLQLPPLPHPATQRGIGEVLGALDDKIAANAQALEVSNSLVRVLYSQLPLSPRALGEIAHSARDFVSSGAETPGESYVALEHFDKKQMWLRRHADAAVATSTKTRFLPGDTLFGKLRPYFHKVARASMSGICSTDILVVRPNSKSDTALVLAAASSDAVVEAAVMSSNGTRMPRAKWQDIASCRVPDPTDPQVRCFVQSVDAITARMDRATEENTALARTRDELLPQLMSGRITVKDAEKRVEEEV